MTLSGFPALSTKTRFTILELRQPPPGLAFSWAAEERGAGRGEAPWRWRCGGGRDKETQGEKGRKTMGNSMAAGEEERGGECGEKDETSWSIIGKVERKERDVTKEEGEREREKGEDKS